MAAKSQFILDQLGDFWRRFKETPDLLAYWDGLIELASNLRGHLEQINRGKGLFTVPVLERSSPVLFVFDATTSLTPPSGYAAAYKIDPEVESIPVLTGNSDGTGVLLTEGVAYDVTSAGVVSFRAVPTRLLFAENVYSNRETVYRNFGYPIGFKKTNSDLYRRQVQGLWYALWNGAAIANIKLGFHILLGLPFVQKGKVLSVVSNPDGTTTVVVDDQTFTLPDYLGPAVAHGDVLENFKPISTGTEVHDFRNDPDFFLAWDLAPAQKFFTFVPVVLADVIQAIEIETGEVFDFSIIRDFLERIKPAYTDYVIGIKGNLNDSLNVYMNSALVEFRVLLSSTVNLNYLNCLILPDFVTVNSILGSTDQERQDNVKDLPEYAMGEEVIALKESLTITDLISLDILVTV